MTSFIDYDFYKDTFGGYVVPESLFKRLAIEASYAVNNLTQGRAKDYTDKEEVKFATCAIMETLFSIEKDGGGVKQSETVGKHSVTYSSISSNKSVRQKCYSSAVTYLADTGLLYSGVY